MNWFKHDTDATQDARLKKLIIRYGPEGYAVYFHCLELIAAETSETNLTFELEHDSEIIADNLHFKGSAEQAGRERVEEIMRFIVEIGLFQASEGHIFCFKLLRRIDMSMTSNPKFRMLIEAAKSENHDGIMTDHDEIMTRHDTIMRASKQASKQEEYAHSCAEARKDEVRPSEASPLVPFDADFSAFWEHYPRKNDKTRARAKYIAQRRKGITHETIMAALEVYLGIVERDRIEAQYIKYGASFLNCLEDYKQAPVSKPSAPSPAYSGPIPEMAELTRRHREELEARDAGL